MTSLLTSSSLVAIAVVPATMSELGPRVGSAQVLASWSERPSDQTALPKRNPGTRPGELAGQSCLQTPNSIQLVGPRELPGGTLKVEGLA